MSRAAIAASLARHELSAGERLVAFSLASFADRDGRARPGTPAAAGRAGLKRSWFLEARELLERRGLVVVEQAATGRGRASTLWLPFAETGPWWEGEINAGLFEALLGYSRAQGAAGCCSPPWRRWPTSSVSSRASRRGSYARRRACRIRPTVGRVPRCLPRASWCLSPGTAAGGKQTAGR